MCVCVCVCACVRVTADVMIETVKRMLLHGGLLMNSMYIYIGDLRNTNAY